MRIERVGYTGVADPQLARRVPGVKVWQPLRGPFERWPHLADFLLALVSFLLTLGMWSLGAERNGLPLETVAGIGMFLCAFVGNFALLWRRSNPLQVHAVVLTASVLVLIGPAANGLVALAFSLYSLGRYAEDDRASLVGMLAALVFVVTDLFLLSTPSVGGTIAAGLVISLWYIGRRLRFRGEYLRLLEGRAEQLEREKRVDAERAIAEERTRIARELHDIVAHQVSLMTVQAGAAKTVADSDPQAARESMAAVEKAGRQALTEMRHLLGLLRPAEGVQDLGPQPGIADLTTLVRKVSEAGLEVSLRTDGQLSGLPARVDLNIYRIVQEALTNALKHAGPGASAVVSLGRNANRIDLSIRDNGRGGNSESTSGHGVVGMRERADLLGGSFSAGPCADRGFEIRASLPLEVQEP